MSNNVRRRCGGWWWCHCRSGLPSSWRPKAGRWWRARCGTAEAEAEMVGDFDPPSLRAQPFATRRRAPSMIKSAHGQSRRANFVSSLRKDCCREVDTCTTSRRAPGDPAHQRGSLDVQSVFRRVEDHRRLRTLFGAASGCDGTASCRYLTARPFGCAGFPGKHRQQSRLDALVDCSGQGGPRASSA